MAQLLVQHRATATRSDCAELLAPPLDEATLLRDVLFILQGLDGQYIRFRPEKPPAAGPRRTFVHGDIVLEGGAVTDEVAEDAAGQSPLPDGYVGGIDFILENSGYSISAPTRALVHTLSELGWLYRTIQRRLQDEPLEPEVAPKSTARRGKGRPRKGMVEQSLHAELLKETSTYFELVTSLEARLEGIEEPSRRPAGAAGAVDGAHDMADGLTLRKLEVWTRSVRLRLRLMGALAADIGRAFSSRAASPDHSTELTGRLLAATNAGGAFLSTLHAYTSNGDPFLAAFSARLLQTLSAPFFAILSRWIYTGELHDPYDEFFVTLNPALDETLRQTVRNGEGYADRSVENGMPSHELWTQKYVFRQGMLPSFLDESFGRKVSPNRTPHAHA
jgi:gamma-tubulin complex component 3